MPGRPLFTEITAEAIPYDTVSIGTVGGGTTAIQCPDYQARLIRFRCGSGTVYLGNGTAVTTTTGWSLTAGQDTGWIPATNVNMFYRVCVGTADVLQYMALK